MKLELMLMPVCLLLAYKASDERCKKDDRERAENILAKMQPKFLLQAGVSADWGIITVAFLRAFDCKKHDIANSQAEMERFLETMDACFVQGGVFCPVPLPTPAAAASSRSSDQPVAVAEGGFITERVRKQMRHRCVFHCGNKPQVVWGECKPAEVEDIHRRVRVAAQACKERVIAEFRGLRMAWSVLRLERLEDLVNRPTPEKQQRMRNDIHMLATAFKLDVKILLREFAEVSKKALCHYAACGANRHDAHFENKTVWSLFLDPDFIDKNFPERPAPFSELPTFLRIYIGLLDGEAQVERDLGGMRNLLDVHSGPIADETLDNVFILRLSGPANPNDIATPARGGGLLPSAFTRECASLWRELHGARVNCAPGDRTGKKRGRQANGFSLGVRGRVLAAAARMRQTSSTYPKEHPTAYGLPAKAFKTAAAPADRSPYWNEKFAKFSKLSKRKAIDNVRPIPSARLMLLRRAGKLSQPVAASTVAFLPPASQACVDHVRVVIGYHACKTAHLVILDTIDRLHQVVPVDETWVIALLYIVGLGKPVTTLDAWIKLRGDVTSPDARRVVINHQAGNKSGARTVEFLIAREFKGHFPEVASALLACVAGDDSAWKIVARFTGNPGKK